MTTEQMISRYNISLQGDNMRVQSSSKVSPAEVEALKAAKPAIIAELKARAAKAEAHKAAIAAIPGLETLRAEISKHNIHADKIRLSYENENGCASRPSKPSSDIAALMMQYPVAALYLKAESYSYASHDAKYAAGRDAMEMIADGRVEEAKARLDGWADKLSID